jgi:hypothetical protein
MFPAPRDYLTHIVSLPMVWISLVILLGLAIAAALVRLRKGRTVAVGVVLIVWFATAIVLNLVFSTRPFSGFEFVATAFVTAIATALVAAPALLAPVRLGWRNLAFFGGIGAVLAAAVLPWTMVVTWCVFGIDCL